MRNTELVITYTNRKVEELEKALNEKVTFDKVAEHYHINFVNKGNLFICKCPFHVDAGESLIYDAAKKEFKCSVCKQSGDIFKFVQLMENCSENEAYAMMCYIGGISNDTIGLHNGERINARVELCARSNNSIKNGVGTVKDLVEGAKINGITALALCDDYSTNGFSELNRYCANYAIDAIYGITVNIENKRIALIAKNKNGIKALNEIISISKPESQSDSYETSYEDLLKFKDNLISIAILDDYEDLSSFMEKYDYIGVKDNGKGYPNAFYANKSEKRIVAISDSYYLIKQDRLLYDSLVGAVSTYYRKLRNRDELSRLFPTEWVENNPIEITKTIDDDCYKPCDKCSVPELISADNFRALVYKCAENKLTDFNENIKNTLEKELNGIINNGWHSLYYLYYQLCEFIKKSNQEFTLRGTAQCSLVNYVLGVSKINPTSWDLPVESFMGFYLDKMPDIDLNVSPLFRENCINGLLNIVGKDNAALASTMNTYYDADALETVAAFLRKTNAYYEDSLNTKVFKLTYSIKSIANHPGGILVKNNNDTFLDVTPLKKISSEDKMLTALNESYGLLDSFPKIDILSNLDMEIANELKKRIDIDYDSIPITKEVLSLFESDQILNKTRFNDMEMNPLFGISEYGTEFMQHIIKVSKPKTIYDIIKISGLAHGTGTWVNNAEYLLNQGYKLENLIGCREDIYNILTKQYHIDHRAAFVIMDDARKGKGIKPANEKVLIGAQVPNYLIWSMKQVKYMFPKSHAVSYAITALKQAYCKIYYPIVFYETLLNIKYASVLDKIDLYSDEELANAINNGQFKDEESRALLLMYEAMERGFLFEIKDKRIRFYKGDVKQYAKK